MKLRKLIIILLIAMLAIQTLFMTCTICLEVIGGFYERKDPNSGYIAKYLHEPGYLRVMGVRNHYRDDFYAVYGEPLRCKETVREDLPSRRFTEEYEGFCLYAVECSPERDPYLLALAMEIFDPSFRFGRLRIGVGSTRAEVEFAYKRDRKLEQSPDYLKLDPFYYADAGYVADRWDYILFCYNENDVGHLR